VVYESYLYDGLDRSTQDSHPDNQYLTAIYGTAVYPSGGGVASQQGSTTTYGWGYPILRKDEARQERQQWIDGFGRIIEVDEATAMTSTPGTGSATILGTEQSTQIYTCQAPQNSAGPVVRQNVARYIATTSSTWRNVFVLG
jgi:hypothetical protein